MAIPQTSRWADSAPPESKVCPDTAVSGVVVIWVDWYAYHVARLRALAEHPILAGRVAGIEMVGGCGVHGNLKFRSDDRDGLSIHTLLPESNWKDAPAGRLVKTLWQKLDELDPAVLLIPGYYTAPAVAAACWGRLHGRTTVLMTETTEDDHQRVWWKEQLKQGLLRTLFGWAIAGGRPHRRYLETLGFPRKRIASMYDVVDNGFFADESAIWRSRKRGSDLPVDYFLYVGRLATEKNVDGLLNSFAAYRRQGGKWSLVLVGDGPLGGHLRRRAQEPFLTGHVHFAGHKSTAETARYYAGARCFVLPSSREPWGLVVNEAMAASLPVLVSDRCGCAEDLVNHGCNGFVFDPADTAGLTVAMWEIERMSATQRDDFGRESLRIISRYSPEAWAEEVVRVAQS